MKRWIVFSLLLVGAYLAGAARVQFLSDEEEKSREQSFRDDIAVLRQRLYGLHSFGIPGLSSEMDAQLASFDPSAGTGSITLSYIGGMDGSDGGSDLHLQLLGDGKVYSENQGSRELVTTLSADRCASVFRRVLMSGILNASEPVIELKRDLFQPDGWKGVTCNPTTQIHVSVPELKVDHTLSIYAPEVELENFPDIIEYRLVIETEAEMLGLVPKNYPPWK